MRDEVFDEIYANIEREVTEQDIRNIYEDLEKAESPVLVLYGAGGNCEYVLAQCEMKKLKVACICDGKAKGTYAYKEKVYEIISPMQLLDEYADAFVLITTHKYASEICEKLCSNGFAEKQIYKLPYPYLITTEVFRKNYLEGYRWAYDFFEDVRSKERVIDRIRLHLLGKPGPADSAHKDGYFAFPDINLNEQEVYIDGGAYIGDTAEEFIRNMKQVDKEYKHIYSFEPDKKNVELALHNLKKFKDVEVLPYGLWSSETELRFANDKDASSYMSSGEENDTVTVPVISLDKVFEDKSVTEWPTIIKMDIEGSEKEALLGAKNIIQIKKPQLIICAYHKPEDIYELPQTIIKIRQDYKFKLWQIEESFWDMILYAI